MLSEQDEKALRALSLERATEDGVVLSGAMLRGLLGEIDALRYGIVRTRQDATVREYGISTLPAGQPAPAPALDDLTEAAAVTVTLEDLVEGISRITVNQASAWPWPAEQSNPWFARGAA